MMPSINLSEPGKQSPSTSKLKTVPARPISVLIRDYALYILIGLAVAAGVMLYAAHAVAGEEVGFRWVGLAISTIYTFGYPLKWYRSYRGHWLFRCALACLVVGHLAAYIFTLRRLEHFGFLWFVILTPIEWIVICPVLDRVGTIVSAEKGHR